MEGLLPLETPPLSTIATGEWRDRLAADGPRRTADGTRGRGSQALSCARRIAFEALGIPRDINDALNMLTFQLGQFVHDTIQRTLVTHKQARIEVPVTYRPDHDVSGTVDGVYDDESPNDTVVEIKSMRQYAFDLATGAKAPRWGDLPGPKRHHLAQAGLYAGAPQLNAAQVHIVYGAKDTGQIAEWLIHVDEPLRHLAGEPTIESLTAGELERFDRIFETLDAGELPARSIPEYGVVVRPPAADTKGQPWQCRYCPYQPTCLRLPPQSVPLIALDDQREPPCITASSTEATRRALLTLVRALPRDRQVLLRERWPKDWPVLKRPQNWTGDLLDQLARLVGSVLEDIGPVPATRSRARPQRATPPRTQPRSRRGTPGHAQ